MAQQSIVRLQKDGKKIEPRYRTECNTKFKKNDKISSAALRTIHQYYGTIEAILRILSLKECEGKLRIAVKDGVVHVHGEIRTYHEIAFRQVNELVQELIFTASCLATQFEAGAVTANIALVQTLEYQSNQNS